MNYKDTIIATMQTLNSEHNKTGVDLIWDEGGGFIEDTVLELLDKQAEVSFNAGKMVGVSEFIERFSKSSK
jgi:NADPH-dependent curcumin reductase CurA